MNAVATEERSSRGRRRRSFEESVVNAELSYWGFWKGIQCAADGYSPEATLHQLLSGRSEVIGHRILCVDMPQRAWRINAKVMLLPRDYIEVLTARYCLPVEPETGRPYEVSYLAALLGIAATTYRWRLTQARQAYQRAIFA